MKTARSLSRLRSYSGSLLFALAALALTLPGTRSAAGPTQQAYLKASNAEAGDNFGLAVAVSGDTMVVGAWREDSKANTVNGDQNDNTITNSGAAYVFVRN